MLGGKGHRAVLLDLDRRFNMFRLMQLLESSVRTMWQAQHDGLTELHDADVDDILRGALARLLIYRPSDSMQFLATLHGLSSLLMGEPGYKLLIIDSIGAFLAADRAETPDADAQTAYQRQVVAALRRLRSNIPLTIIALKPALFSPHGTASLSGVLAHSQTPFSGQHDTEGFHFVPYREYLCTTWQNFVKQRMSLASKPAPDGSVVIAVRSGNVLAQFPVVT